MRASIGTGPACPWAATKKFTFCLFPVDKPPPCVWGCFRGTTSDWTVMIPNKRLRRSLQTGSCLSAGLSVSVLQGETRAVWDLFGTSAAIPPKRISNHTVAPAKRSVLGGYKDRRTRVYSRFTCIWRKQNNFCFLHVLEHILERMCCWVKATWNPFPETLSLKPFLWTPFSEPLSLNPFLWTPCSVPQACMYNTYLYIDF